MAKKTWKQVNRDHPLLWVRMKPAEMQYVRDKAREHGLSLARYVRRALVPFDLKDLSDGKN